MLAAGASLGSCSFEVSSPPLYFDDGQQEAPWIRQLGGWHPRLCARRIVSRLRAERIGFRHDLADHLDHVIELSVPQVMRHNSHVRPTPVVDLLARGVPQDVGRDGRAPLSTLVERVVHGHHHLDGALLRQDILERCGHSRYELPQPRDLGGPEIVVLPGLVTV